MAEQGYLGPLDHGADSSCRSLYALALMFPLKLSSHTGFGGRTMRLKSGPAKQPVKAVAGAPAAATARLDARSPAEALHARTVSPRNRSCTPVSRPTCAYPTMRALTLRCNKDPPLNQPSLTRLVHGTPAQPGVRGESKGMGLSEPI